ncbi:cystatin-A-like [Saccostrea echinata]|uniref:cystatin-A-like n=1 Tax=Saccostrea echinata TaxID=191078 RepID=UPI002A83775A|nr:cystatin-A-like [Saccostrea echinata]
MKAFVAVILSLSASAVFFVNATDKPVVGGLGKAKLATKEIQELVDSVRDDIISNLPIGYDREMPLPLKARFYREQVVAGTNYFIKIQTGPLRFIHVRIFKDLQGVASVSGVQINKLLRDPLEYF